MLLNSFFFRETSLVQQNTEAPRHFDISTYYSRARNFSFSTPYIYYIKNIEKNQILAEAVGFEPTEVLPSTVFETAAISQTLPHFHFNPCTLTAGINRPGLA